MAGNNRFKLTIERTVCYVIAALGAILVWTSVAQAAEPVEPSFQDVLTSVTATARPEPATLAMLTCGIFCVVTRLRRGSV